MRLDLDRIGGSALTDPAIAVPEAPGEGIPVTYVPARNTVLLGLALAYAEVIEARDLFIGVNALDYSGYPDCRPEFIRAFEALARLATKAGVEGARFRIHTPLIALSKSEIIQRARAWASTMGSPSPAIRPTTPAAPAGVATPAASAARASPPPASPIRPGIAEAPDGVRRPAAGAG